MPNNEQPTVPGAEERARESLTRSTRPSARQAARDRVAARAQRQRDELDALLTAESPRPTPATAALEAAARSMQDYVDTLPAEIDDQEPLLDEEERPEGQRVRIRGLPVGLPLNIGGFRYEPAPTELGGQQLEFDIYRDGPAAQALLRATKTQDGWKVATLPRLEIIAGRPTFRAAVRAGLTRAGFRAGRRR